MVLSGKGRRAKGATFEREVVNAFRQHIPTMEARRGLQSRGEEVPDVDTPLFWAECKRHKRCNIRAAYAQADANASKGRMPIAVTRDDGGPALVTLSLEDFLELSRMAWQVYSL